MDEYTATETAYKNGRAAGFADGLAAAGIAPIQWRDARDLPLPERGDVILWTADGDFRSGQITRSGRAGYVHLVVDRLGTAVWIPAGAVAFWCPVQPPLKM